jgi:hypothetical protein
MKTIFGIRNEITTLDSNGKYAPLVVGKNIFRPKNTVLQQLSTYTHTPFWIIIKIEICAPCDSVTRTDETLKFKFPLANFHRAAPKQAFTLIDLFWVRATVLYNGGDRMKIRS